jgi:hypothetical protein
MFLQIFACYMRLNMESQIRDFRYSAAIRTKELEKRIAVAIAFGIAAAIYVAGDDHHLSSADSSVVFAFLVGMLSVNFICRKVVSWRFHEPQPSGEPS